MARSGPRLVFFATTDDGEVQAIHCIFLNPDGTNCRRPDGSKAKITNGAHDGAVVRLPATNGSHIAGPLPRAESCETGLSGWAATGFATWICLGGIARVIPPHGRLVIDLRDDDRSVARAISLPEAA